MTFNAGFFAPDPDLIRRAIDASKYFTIPLEIAATAYWYTIWRQLYYVPSQMGMDPETVSDEDCSALRFVCEMVSRRASFMASAGITALLKMMQYKDVVIAIDGSLFRYHPHFKNIMQSR